MACLVTIEGQVYSSDNLRPARFPTNEARWQYGGPCLAPPIDPDVIQASRDGELPSRRPTSTGCPTCGCSTFGGH